MVEEERTRAEVKEEGIARDADELQARRLRTYFIVVEIACK